MNKSDVAILKAIFNRKLVNVAGKWFIHDTLLEGKIPVKQSSVDNLIDEGYIIGMKLSKTGKKVVEEEIKRNLNETNTN